MACAWIILQPWDKFYETKKVGPQLAHLFRFTNVKDLSLHAASHDKAQRLAMGGLHDLSKLRIIC